MLKSYKNKVAVLVALFFLLINSSSASVQFSWGGQHYEFKAITPRSFYSIQHIQKVSLLELVKKEFYVYDGAQVVNKFDTREVVYFIQRNNGSFYNLSLDSVKNLIHPENYHAISKNLKPGDAIDIILTAAGKKYVFRAQLPYADLSYTPKFFLLKYGLNQLYNYQVLTTYDGTNIVKLDTTQPASKKILDGYRKVANTRILHIKDFTSSQNYINEADSVLEVVKGKINLHTAAPLDFSILSQAEEPQDFLSRGIALKWSRMIAAHDGPTYSRRYARNQAHHNLIVEVDGVVYPVIGARLSFLNNDGLNMSYYIKESTQPVLQTFMDQVDPFSVVIDRVVIRDKQNNREIFIPQAFLFNFE